MKLRYFRQYLGPCRTYEKYFLSHLLKMLDQLTRQYTKTYLIGDLS